MSPLTATEYPKKSPTCEVPTAAGFRYACWLHAPPLRVNTYAAPEPGADSFGVGSYISAAKPIDMTMDIKEISGKAIAKRGRIPGRIENPGLVRFI